MSYPHRWVALVGLLLAEAMNLLDATIVQVAAPAIHTGLTGPDSDIQWFSAAYTLPLAMVLITGGRLGDIYRRRRIFRIGVAGFVLASTVCALSTSAGMLIATRAGRGGRIDHSADVRADPRHVRRRGSAKGAGFHRSGDGTCGGVGRSPAGCSPTPTWSVRPGGRCSWSTCHWASACCCLLALAMLGAGLLMYPLIQATWSASTWVLLAAGAVVFGSLARQQRANSRRGGDSLIALTLFGNQGFLAALVCLALFFAVLNGVMLVVVLRLQLGLHASVLTASLSLLPWSIGMGVSAVLAGRSLYPRYAPRSCSPGSGCCSPGSSALPGRPGRWAIRCPAHSASPGSGSACSPRRCSRSRWATSGRTKPALLVSAGMVVLTAIGAAIMVNGARRRSGEDQVWSEDSDSVFSD